MVFEISKASNSSYEETKEFKTLEELMEWIDTVGKVIFWDTTDLQIYDSWVE